MMNTYAAYYDAVNAGYYKKMARFFRRNVRFSGKDVLCLASGTGYFPEFYLDSGARRVTSVDISADFMRLARRRLGGHPRRGDVEFIHADMARFETARRYDLVFLNGNSFCYLLTQDEQLACLGRIRRHLKSGGRAYISLAPLSRRLNGDFRYRRFGKTEGGKKVEQNGQVSVDLTRHRLDFNITWRVAGRTCRDVVRTRIMTVPEFALLIRVAGLRATRVWADFRLRISADPYNRMYELKT